MKVLLRKEYVVARRASFLPATRLYSVSVTNATSTYIGKGLLHLRHTGVFNAGMFSQSLPLLLTYNYHVLLINDQEDKIELAMLRDLEVPIGQSVTPYKADSDED
jgi:hypothetical protein